MNKEELLNEIEAEMIKTKSSLIYLCLEETANRLKSELNIEVSKRTMCDLVINRGLKVNEIDKEVKLEKMTFPEYVNEINKYIDSNKKLNINKPEEYKKEENFQKTSMFSF